MAQDKLLVLFRRLLAATKSGKVNWLRTPDAGSFVASFPKYSVSIANEQYFDEDSHSEDTVVKLSILDHVGDVVEEIYPGTLVTLGLPTSYGEMNHLYAAARRKAMGVDQALDTILAALPADDNFSDEIEKDNEEVPF